MKTDLLPKVAKGDQRAAHAMIPRYGHRIWSIALRLLYEETHAAMATRMIFILLRRHAGRYQSESMSELLFVTIVARRYCLNYRKNSKNIEFSEQISENFAKTWKNDFCKEALLVLRSLKNIPNLEQVLLKYYVVKGFSPKQLAKQYNLSLSDVLHHLCQGLGYLKQRYTREYQLHQKQMGLLES